jgi:glycosyltransferase involved in cell wall biosynthesis
VKILFIVPYAPTLIRTRPYNLIQGLLKRGHQLVLATTWENKAEFEALDVFTSQGVRVISSPLKKTQILMNMARALLTGVPLQSLYCWIPGLSEAIFKYIVAHPVDLIHIEHLRGSSYASSLKSHLEREKLKIPIIWDSVDCISLLFEQAIQHSRSGFGKWVTRIELPRTKRYEAYLSHQFDRVLITSYLDKMAFEHLSGDAWENNLAVVANGVDVEYFTPAELHNPNETIIFSGKLSYHANVTAALFLVHEIMPIVWQKRPEVCVQLVGKDPHPSIHNLTDKEPRVCITGTVPDIRPYLQRADVAVAPILYGAGIQNKVLEAMACGIPVVASPQAISALSDLRVGEDILVASNPEDYANSIIELLEDRKRSEQIGQNGRDYVLRCHNWIDVVEGLEHIYHETLS